MKRNDSTDDLPLERLLIYLRLAIEEARMTRSVVESRLVLNGREANEVTRAGLAALDREIAFLETQVVDLSARLESVDAAEPRDPPGSDFDGARELRSAG